MINFHKYIINTSETEKFDLKVGVDYFQNAFDFRPSEIFLSKLEEENLRYRNITSNEFEQHLLNFLNFIDDVKHRAGPKRQVEWQIGWAQNLTEFTESNFDIDALIPHYYRRGQNIMRFNGKYIMPEHQMFENKMRELILLALVEKYFNDFSHIYEFAAGPCHNIISLAKNTKNKMFKSFDWVDSSINIMNVIDKQKEKLGIASHKFSAEKFNFFDPNYAIKLKPRSIAFTFGGLEQIGTDYQKVLDYFLSQEDVTFIHIEPFVELYDRSTLFGELGYRYAVKRNYLNGFYKSLYTLKKNKEINLTEATCVLGSAFHDGWIFTQWRK